MKLLLSLLFSSAMLLASIDINHADAKELALLNGISTKKAEAIIAFRSKNGCFKSVEDLVNVKGIGSKTVEKNRAVLEAKKCETN